VIGEITDLESVDQALCAAGVPPDVALMWLGVSAYRSAFTFRTVGDDRDEPEWIADFASTCERLAIPPDEGIHWYQCGVDSGRLAAYVKRGRTPSDYRVIRAVVDREMDTRRRWRRGAWQRHVHAWMLCAAPVDLVADCVRAGVKPTEIASVLAADDPLRALEMLAALRGR
jgi:hypothetical protein